MHRKWSRGVILTSLVIFFLTCNQAIACDDLRPDYGYQADNHYYLTSSEAQTACVAAGEYCSSNSGGGWSYYYFVTPGVQHFYAYGCSLPPENCLHRPAKIIGCGGEDNVQCDNQCQCACIDPCASQKQAKVADCGTAENVQCDESCNCSCITPPPDQCVVQRQAKVEECLTLENVECDGSCNCSCKAEPPVSYWLMATRDGCSPPNPTNICGTLVSKFGSGLPAIDASPVFPCDPSAGGSLAGGHEAVVAQPVYQVANSAAGGINVIVGGVSLPALSTGFYVFAWDASQQKWQYKNAITLGVTSRVAATACNIRTPSNCKNSFTVSCAAPSDANPPEDNGGGACDGQGAPAKTCLNAGGVVWDDKESCTYHCADCEGQYADYVNTCVNNTLSTYGDVEDCTYYCDCSKASAQRNIDCPMGATINNQTCSYTCTPCTKLMDKCKTDCQAQYGQDPITNTCQESLMGAPYERECKCPPAGPQTGGGGTDTGTGGTDPADPADPADPCPECSILQRIKEDTGALVRQGNDQTDLLGDTVNRLGELYKISSDHYTNNERLLEEIRDAIINKEFTADGGGSGGVTVNVDMASVVAAINSLRDPLTAFRDATHQDLTALKTDLHSALYDGGTPYLSSILAEMRRITKGLLETENGSQPNSFINKFQNLTYLDVNGDWTMRTSGSATNGWDALIALLNAYLGGSSPSVPEFASWDLSTLTDHADPAYQAAQTLTQMDVASAATDAASRYNSLPKPVLTLLNPQPCITGNSGLSICFNTDVWQTLYVQLRLWGYFFAHLSVFVMVYRARTGISPSAASDE